MKSTNLKVNLNCIQCGSCLGCGFDFLSSDSDGSIKVRPGTILDETSAEYRTLREVCPSDAFELEKGIDKQRMLHDLLDELKRYTGIPKPTENDLRFRKDEYRIAIPSASGEYRYEYSSDSAAERAALREFERAMYSQIDNIILKIITDYRIRYVKSYYTDKEEEGSVYVKSNKKVSEMLEGIKCILGSKLPSDFSSVNVMPNNDLYWKMLNKGEVVSDELISAVKSEFDYPSSQYDCYWRTDDREVPSGTDWRGNTKWKERYCYKNVREAFEELAKDLLNACGWASDSIERQAVEKAGWLVDVYNKDLKAVIDQKLKQIENAKE